MLMHQQTRAAGDAKLNLQKPRGGGGNVRELQIPNLDKKPEGVHVVLCPGSYLNPIDSMGTFIPDPSKWLQYPFFPYVSVKRSNPEGVFPRFEQRQDSIGWDRNNLQLSVFDYYFKYDSDKVKNLSRAQKKAITVLGIVIQHKVPSMDDKGQVKRDKSGVPYTNFRDCSKYAYGSNKCNYCLDINAYPYSIGKKYYLSLGSGHFEDIEAISAMISNRCECGGTITLQQLTCPRCNAIIADASRDVSDEQMNNIAGKTMHCYNCHFEGYPAEYAVRCTRCQTPKRMEITNRVLAIGRQVNPAKTTDSKIVLVNDWSFEQYDRTELATWNTTTRTLLEAFGQPIDFNVSGDLRMLTLSEQAEWLKLPLPPHMQAAAAQQDAERKQQESETQRSQPTVGNIATPYPQTLGQPTQLPNMGPNGKTVF